MDSSAMESSSVDSSAVDSSAREAALRKRRERDRDRRARESSEQWEARLSRCRLADRERARVRRGSETATQREVRLARRRIADRSRRVSQSQSMEESLHQLRVKRAKLELTNDAAFNFWSCFSPIVEQIPESDHMTIKTLLFSKQCDAEYSPTEIITKIHSKCIPILLVLINVLHYTIIEALVMLYFIEDHMYIHDCRCTVVKPLHIYKDCAMSMMTCSYN